MQPVGFKKLGSPRTPLCQESQLRTEELGNTDGLAAHRCGFVAALTGELHSQENRFLGKGYGPKV